MRAAASSIASGRLSSLVQIASIVASGSMAPADRSRTLDEECDRVDWV